MLTILRPAPMALAFRQLSIDISANVSILFVGTVVVNNILFFLFLETVSSQCF